MTSRAAQARLAMGAGAVLSVQAAAELLPVHETRARAWIEVQGLVRQVPGLGQVVIWADVLDALRRPCTTSARATRAASTPRRGRLPRVSLD